MTGDSYRLGRVTPATMLAVDDDDEVMLNVLRSQLTY